MSSASIFTDVNELQFIKALYPIEVTLLGIVIELILSQFSNALFPITFNEFGKETFDNDEQFIKQLFPIEVILLYPNQLADWSE